MSSSGRAVTLNAPGSFVGRIAYSPFGLIRSFTGGLTTDKRFTGQRLDDTGLYYYNARYYDTTIRRFISADTVVPDPYDPQCLNRYTYVLNNPLKYTDPSGQWLETLLDIAGILYDAYEISRDPGNAWNWVSLGADVVCAFVPFVAGGGAAVRGAKITTKIVNRMGDASDAVKAVDRTHDYARTIGGAWDVTDTTGKVNRWMEVGRRGGRSLEHQSEMSGQAIRRIGGKSRINEFRYNGICFDDFKGGKLFDYKADYSKFIGSNGQFKDWFRGASSLRNQAKRQVAATNGIPVVRRVGQSQVAAFTDVTKGIKGLAVMP